MSNLNCAMSAFTVCLAWSNRRLYAPPGEPHGHVVGLQFDGRMCFEVAHSRLRVVPKYSEVRSDGSEEDDGDAMEHTGVEPVVECVHSPAMKSPGGVVMTVITDSSCRPRHVGRSSRTSKTFHRTLPRYLQPLSLNYSARCWQGVTGAPSKDNLMKWWCKIEG